MTINYWLLLHNDDPTHTHHPHLTLYTLDSTHTHSTEEDDEEDDEEEEAEPGFKPLVEKGILS